MPPIILFIVYILRYFFLGGKGEGLFVLYKHVCHIFGSVFLILSLSYKVIYVLDHGLCVWKCQFDVACKKQFVNMTSQMVMSLT